MVVILILDRFIFVMLYKENYDGDDEYDKGLLLSGKRS